jgi:hypothetical protein
VNIGLPENRQLDAAYCSQVSLIRLFIRQKFISVSLTKCPLADLQHSVVNSQYIEMLLRMGKTVVGVETWKQRGESCNGNFEEMLLITDEVLIAWTVDGQYNGWCHEYGKRNTKNRRNAMDSDESSPADTSGDENRNRMDVCKQQQTSDPEDWLNYGRPLSGPWFVRKTMDAGFTKKHGGTTEFGKNRWNHWGRKIAERRRAKHSEDPALKQKYRLFCMAFQDAWKAMYHKGSRSNNSSNESDKETIEAFNGIDWM